MCVKTPFSFQGQSSFPYLSGYTWVSFCNWKMLNCDYGNGPVRFHPENVKSKDTVFVDYNCLKDFSLRILPYIKTEIILVTANYGYGADHPMPGPFAYLLKEDKIKAWFVQNIDRAFSEKLIPIPIGLANRCWEHGNTDLFDALISLSLSKPFKSHFCYLNYTPLPNRAECTQHFRKLNIPLTPKKKFFDYLQDLSESVFVISPPGNGLDCHRTWEALYMGAFPVVLSSTLNPLYEGLPVVVIESWEEVTYSFLNEQYKKLKDQAFCREKLYAPFWFQKVKTISSRLD